MVLPSGSGDISTYGLVVSGETTVSSLGLALIPLLFLTTLLPLSRTCGWPALRITAETVTLSRLPDGTMACSLKVAPVLKNSTMGHCQGTVK